ncbi:hypothetical protein GL50803_0041619 [Giardia duodenalis]|uniref:Uncharacterized protein n=2 Tax=Giardia intestinalis (strain ATCC 50803 / WB clone C6) TaxID=184922 RepID=A8B909_GIAIC|nr:hypothetical protein GL50803_0041619 [Giardia intestinalis]KAE8302352.1 hypothetical protein GL50803_0041619 [Giardia intestinalis]|eukprot:XP_001708737.1 Hypothetical protein GL50803_41619 [Giardia lamblia ATCC 50803]
MPPKDPAEEQELKAYNKALEEKQRQEMIIYREEFKRYQVIRDMLLEYWNHVCLFIQKADNLEKERIAAESHEMLNLLQTCGMQAADDMLEIEQERNWQIYLGKNSTEKSVLAQTEILIAEVELLLKHIHPDSTTHSLRQNLSGISSVRRFIEDKATLFDIYVAIACEVSNVLASLEKTIRHSPDFGMSQLRKEDAAHDLGEHQPARTLEDGDHRPDHDGPGPHLAHQDSPSLIPTSLLSQEEHAANESDIPLILTDVPGNRGTDQTAQQELCDPTLYDPQNPLIARPIFQPKQSLPDIVDATLRKTYIRPITVGRRAQGDLSRAQSAKKIQQAAEKSPGGDKTRTASPSDEAGKQGKGKKKGKTQEAVAEQEFPDEQVKSFIMYSDNRIYNFDSISCGVLPPNPTPASVPPNLTEKEKRGFSRMKSGTITTTDTSAARIRSSSSGSTSPLPGGQISQGGVQFDAQLDKGIDIKNATKYDQYMTYITTPTLLLRTMQNQQYIPRSQLEKLAHIATLQAQRVQLRSILFTLHDMCSKYLLDHSDDYLPPTAEPIKLSAPADLFSLEEYDDIGESESSDTRTDKASEDLDSNVSDRDNILDPDIKEAAPKPSKAKGGISLSALEAHNAAIAAKLQEQENAPSDSPLQMHPGSKASTRTKDQMTLNFDGVVKKITNTDIIHQNRANAHGPYVPLILSQISKRDIKHDETFISTIPLSVLDPSNTRYIGCRSTMIDAEPTRASDNASPCDIKLGPTIAGSLKSSSRPTSSTSQKNVASNLTAPKEQAGETSTPNSRVVSRESIAARDKLSKSRDGGFRAAQLSSTERGDKESQSTTRKNVTPSLQAMSHGSTRHALEPLSSNMLTVELVNKYLYYFGKRLNFMEKKPLNHALHVWINTAKNPRFRNVRFTPALKLVLPNSLCLSNVAVRLCVTPIDLVGYKAEGLSYMSLQKYVDNRNLRMYEFSKTAKLNKNRPAMSSLAHVAYPDIVSFCIDTYISKIIVPQQSQLNYIETETASSDLWMTDTLSMLTELGFDLNKALAVYNLAIPPELLEKAITHINIRTLVGHKQKLHALYKIIHTNLLETLKDMCLTNIAYLFKINCINLIVRNICMLELLISEDERNNCLMRHLIVKIVEEEILISEAAKKRGKKGKKDKGKADERPSLIEMVTRDDILHWEKNNSLLPAVFVPEAEGSRPNTASKKGPKLDKTAFPTMDETVKDMLAKITSPDDMSSSETDLTDSECAEIVLKKSRAQSRNVHHSTTRQHILEEDELSEEELKKKERIVRQMSSDRIQDDYDAAFEDPPDTPLIPELLPVGEMYFLNIIRIPPQLTEANNWLVLPLTHTSVEEAHQAKLTDGLDHDFLTDVAQNLNYKAMPENDTQFVATHAERYQPISLERRLVSNTVDRDYADTHFRFDDSIGEVDDDASSPVRDGQKKPRNKKRQTNTRDLIFTLTYVEHLPYPITTQIIPIYPGCTILRCSEIAKERAALLAFDSVTLWSWIPNIFNYTQSTLTKELLDENGELEETLNVDDEHPDPSAPGDDQQGDRQPQDPKPEEGDQAQSDPAPANALPGALPGGPEPQKEQIEPITLEFVLPPELYVARILTAEEAVYSLQKAMLSHDQTSLLGVYFVGIWNIAINSWDVDGIQSVVYKPEKRTVVVKLLKTGPLSIVALKYSSLPYRAWSLTPCLDRGDNLNIDECADLLGNYIYDPTTGMLESGASLTKTGLSNSYCDDLMDTRKSNARGPMASITSQNGQNSKNAQLTSISNVASRGRVTYYHQGATGNKIPVPKLTERSIRLYKQSGVVVHSVLMKLALPSGILLYLRILPEGYEIVGFTEIPGFTNFVDNLRANDYLPQQQLCSVLNISHLTTTQTMSQSLGNISRTKGAAARARQAAELAVAKSTFEAHAHIRCPRAFRNVIFPSTTELFSALTRSGIFLSHTSDHDILQANLRPKNRNIDVEMARQLAVLSCVNLSASTMPLVQVIGASPWNRRLPNEPILPPPQNQFQITEEKFVESLKRSRGWLSELELREHEKAERKRERAEKKRLEQEAKKPGSTVPPPKKVEQKIEKGMPEPLGPGTYGFTKLTVDIRANAVADLKVYMSEYLKSIFPIQAVSYDHSACFVVGCSVSAVDMTLPPSSSTNSLNDRQTSSAGSVLSLTTPKSAASARGKPAPPVLVDDGQGGMIDVSSVFAVRPVSTAYMTSDERAELLSQTSDVRDQALTNLISKGMTLHEFSKTIYGLIKEPAPKPHPPEYTKAVEDIEKYNAKHKKGKKGKRSKKVVEEDDQAEEQNYFLEPRVTQTKPYDTVTCDFYSALQNNGLSLRTFCITEGMLGAGNFTTRACAVPFSPDTEGRKGEQFCPASCFGCESHSTALHVILSKLRNLDATDPFAISASLKGCCYDPVLVIMVFRLVQALRLASLG